MMFYTAHIYFQSYFRYLLHPMYGYAYLSSLTCFIKVTASLKTRRISLRTTISSPCQDYIYFCTILLFPFALFFPLFISSLAGRVNFGKLLRMMNDGGFRRNTTESSRNLRLTAPKWIKSWSKFANGRFNITRYQTRERGKMRGYVKFHLLRQVQCNQVGIKIDYYIFHERNLLQDDTKDWRIFYDNLKEGRSLADLSSIWWDMISVHVLFTNIIHIKF